MGAFEISNETSWEVDDIVAGNASNIGPSYIRVIGTQLIFQGWWEGGSSLWMHDPIGVTVSGPSSGPVTNATCEISPSLPSGLTLTQGTCTISGAPTVAQSSTAYTLWVNDSGVSDSTTIDITIEDVIPSPPSISPTSISVVLTRTVAMTPVVFTNTGGTIDSWKINPDLPAGLSMNEGTITGTPTLNQDAVIYTVWGNNSDGQSNASLTITINEPAPEFSYVSDNLSLIRGEVMENLESISIGGVINSWQVNQSLPTGLSLNGLNGTISGTPSINQDATLYTIWGNNSGGSASAEVTITIVEDVPEFSYDESELTLIRYVKMDDLVPSITGGVVDSWAINPELPEGLEFSEGEVSGIPLINMTDTTYTVWANNTQGSASNTFTITILEPPEGLISSQVSAVLVRDVEMYGILFTYIGGEIDTWELEPNLPTGLVFDATNHTIHGTPVSMMAEGNYTIWANSSDVSDSVTITLEVLEDTDGDGFPDDMGDLTWPGLDEDLDDDADGISDVEEGLTDPATNPLLADTDGDGVCDGSLNVTIRDVEICTGGPDHFPTDPAADTDTDGDGDPDDVRDGFETNLTEDIDDDMDGLWDENETADGSLTDPLLPDTDGDGVCDGSINVTINQVFICTGGPDAFPNDPAADTDTDGDGKPDELHGNSTTGLLEDLDDDGDQASDIVEIENGTDPKNPLDFPTDDADADGWTDAQEDFCGTDKNDNSSVPADLDQDGWCDVDDPDDDGDGWSDSMEGDCGSDPLDESDVPGDDDGDGVCNSLEKEGAAPRETGFPWWMCALVLLTGLLIAPIIIRIKEQGSDEEEGTSDEDSDEAAADEEE
ncbi:MAG: putative Ig domain-containing protein [Candidatus Thermoplasmatota archaeon]|nr:putative Ig domain-containing protein [Candidatus Thermoplasmatota archaeon]